jgi:hypothetical protein
MPLAKAITFALFLLLLLAIFILSSRPRPIISTLRLLALPFIAFLLLTATVHPWYILILIAFLPFLTPAQTEARAQWLHPLPWLYLSGALPLSYLTYLNRFKPGELEWVRLVEWLPTLALLAAPVLMQVRSSLTPRAPTRPPETAASDRSHSQSER